MISFKVGHSLFNCRVAGVCIHDGHVLLQRSASGRFWFLPGGRVEIMESSEAAIKREMREELKLDRDIQVKRLLWVNENLFLDSAEGILNPEHEIGFYYQIAFDDHSELYEKNKPLVVTEDTGIFADQPITFELRWVSLDALDDIPLYPRFLKTGLRNLPASMQHIAQTDSDV